LFNQRNLKCPLRKNKVLQIGITGGIGSGKSLVTKVFSLLNVPIYDSDSEAKSLMNSDAVLVNAIIKEFGEESYLDGKLNRAYLGKQVFGNQEKLRKMNQLVHPRVGEHYKTWVDKHIHKSEYVIKEAALIFENQLDRSLDKVIVVSAPKELRVQRVLKRDSHRSQEDILKIMDKQLPETQKLEKADFVVMNDNHTLILPQVLEIHQSILSLYLPN